MQPRIVWASVSLMADQWFNHCVPFVYLRTSQTNASGLMAVATWSYGRRMASISSYDIEYGSDGRDSMATVFYLWTSQSMRVASLPSLVEVQMVSFF